MLFAAAAVVGSQNARAHKSSTPISFPSAARRGSDSGAGGGAVISCCFGTCLLIAGTSVFAASFHNSRGEHVEDYNKVVERWTGKERNVYEQASFDLRILHSNVTSVMVDEQIPMHKSEAVDFHFHDSEFGQGVTESKPLKFVRQINTNEDLYSNASLAGDVAYMIDLLSEANRPMVQFEFTSYLDGKPQKFSTEVIPLMYTQAVAPRTPAQSLKCKFAQHGVWFKHHCHIVKRLTHLCLQVEKVADGSWQAVRVPEGVAGAAGHTDAFYGCGPKKAHWAVAAYDYDTCWGPLHQRSSRCPSSSHDLREHTIEITLRSKDDPFLRAEELTDDTFDFGESVETQRFNGSFLVLLGFVLSSPCLCYVFCVGCWKDIAIESVPPPVAAWIGDGSKKRQEKNCPTPPRLMTSAYSAAHALPEHALP